MQIIINIPCMKYHRQWHYNYSSSRENYYRHRKTFELISLHIEKTLPLSPTTMRLYSTAQISLICWKTNFQLSSSLRSSAFRRISLKAAEKKKLDNSFLNLFSVARVSQARKMPLVFIAKLLQTPTHIL